MSNTSSPKITREFRQQIRARLKNLESEATNLLAACEGSPMEGELAIIAEYSKFAREGASQRVWGK